MFGQNVIRKPDYENTGKAYYVQEVFRTLQGEGPSVGTPAVFVRLSGCNLRCHFCDTDFESHRSLRPLAQLVSEIKRAAGPPGAFTCSLVVLTGGEPMLQNLGPLIVELIPPRGIFRVEIETAGTVIAPWFESQAVLGQRPGAVRLICSPKTPRIDDTVRALVEYDGAYKYIIRAGCVDLSDGLPNVGTQPTTSPTRGDGVGKLARPSSRMAAERIFVQPCDDRDRETNKLNTAEALWSATTFGYRLSLQTHKLLDLP